MIDEFTKLAFARMYATKTSSNAKDFFLRVNYLLDGGILNSHQDNGSEFKKCFEQICQKENVEQYYNRPRTPKDNPSLERFNQTLEKEWIQDGHFTPDVQKFNQELTPYLIEYNFVRPHETLGYLTPIEWAIKYKQLSQMYSSSTGNRVKQFNYLTETHFGSVIYFLTEIGFNFFLISTFDDLFFS